MATTMIASTSSINAQHKAMYKATFGSEPIWKEKFKEKCLHKMQQHKKHMLQNMRTHGKKQDLQSHLSALPSVSSTLVNTLPSLITEQWSQFATQQTNPPFTSQPFQFQQQNFSQTPFGFSSPSSSSSSIFTPISLSKSTSEDNNNVPEYLSSEDYVDIMHWLEQQLLEDMRKEEEAMIREYQEAQKFEEQQLESVVNSMYSDEVVCPICKQNKLLENKGVIFCACGLRLDVMTDKISLQYLQQSLFEAVQTHSNACPHQPNFGLITQSKITTLCLNCDHCGALDIIV